MQLGDYFTSFTSELCSIPRLPPLLPDCPLTFSVCSRQPGCAGNDSCTIQVSQINHDLLTYLPMTPPPKIPHSPALCVHGLNARSTMTYLTLPIHSPAVCVHGLALSGQPRPNPHPSLPLTCSVCSWWRWCSWVTRLCRRRLSRRKSASSPWTSSSNSLIFSFSSSFSSSFFFSPSPFSFSPSSFFSASSSPSSALALSVSVSALSGSLSEAAASTDSRSSLACRKCVFVKVKTSCQQWWLFNSHVLFWGAHVHVESKQHKKNNPRQAYWLILSFSPAEIPLVSNKGMKRIMLKSHTIPHSGTQHTTQLKYKHAQAHHQPVAPPDQPWPGASSHYVAECGQRPGGVCRWHAWRTPPSAPAAAPALVCPTWTAGSEMMLSHSFHLGQKRTDAGKCKTDTYTST